LTKKVKDAAKDKNKIRFYFRKKKIKKIEFYFNELLIIVTGWRDLSFYGEERQGQIRS